MKRSRIVLLVAALLISGCAAERASQDMRQSDDAYQICSAENQKNLSACMDEKESYEATEKTYEGMKVGNNNYDTSSGMR